MWRLFVTVVALTAGPVRGDFKQWVHSTNFEDPTNWNVGRVPCSRDRVHLPEGMPSVFVQTNTTVTELVFPNNGELILGSYISIGVPTTSGDEACTGEDVEFSRTDPLSWFDPSNWCVTADAEGQCIANQPDLLETEQIPCQQDTVAFPAARSFLVSLATGIDIYLSALFVRGTSYNTGMFRQFVDNGEGRKEFIREEGEHDSTVNIHADVCSEDSGCACGNDQGPISTRICDSYQSCVEPLCTHPLLPMGGCCVICGAILELEYLPHTYRMDTFKGMLQSKYLRNQDAVHSIVSKTSLDMIQVVLYDTKGGDPASGIGEQLNQALLDDIAGSQRYGVSSVTMKSSRQAAITPAPLRELSSGQLSGIVIGVIIAIVVFILLILLLAYRRSAVRRLELPKSLKNSFKRFRRGTDGELHKPDSVAFSDLAQGFDNPMYDTSLPAAAKTFPTNGTAVKEPLPEVAEITVNDGGFDNPLYGQGPVESTVEVHVAGSAGSADITDMVDHYAGISNPLYGAHFQEVLHPNSALSGTAAISSNGTGGATYLHLNPAFSTEGVEDDTDV